MIKLTPEQAAELAIENEIWSSIISGIDDLYSELRREFPLLDKKSLKSQLIDAVNYL